MLPSSPKWSVEKLELEGYQTDVPIILYKRDALECVEYLFNNPLFANNMNYIPVKHFTADDKRVITEPISARAAWDIQVTVHQTHPGALLTQGLFSLNFRKVQHA